jgi:hypothetical protein
MCPLPPAGVGYTGAVNSAGKPHGKGMMISAENGGWYDGELVDGRKEGKGTQAWTASLKGASLEKKYEGDWVK